MSRHEAGGRVNANEFKSVMARFATGVTVVVTGAPGELRGMTANAFTSVSLDPPLVLVCIERRARSNRLLAETGAFSISILGEEQAHLSDRFASIGSVPADPFADLALGTAVTGQPYLKDSVGWLDCELVASYGAGDHTIHVGEVRALGAGPLARPLLYFRSRYWKLPERNGREKGGR